MKRLTTGIGSMPGDDPLSSARWVSDLWNLPHLPELPTRGPWTGMIGRAASILVDLPVDLQPRGWRLVDRIGQDLRRAQRFLTSDIDAFEEALTGFEGAIKFQVAGPWTLISQLITQRDRQVLTDTSACRDVTQSLAAGISEQIRRMRAIDGVNEVIVQIDEPSISGVLAGVGGTLLSAPRVPDVHEVQNHWQTVVDEIHRSQGQAVLHICAPKPPLEMAHAFDAVSIPLSTDVESISPWLDAEKPLWLGVVQSVESQLPSVASTADRVRTLMKDAGFSERLDLLSITPECGFPEASVGYIKEVSKHCSNVLEELQ